MLGKKLICKPSAAEAVALSVKGIDPVPHEITVFKRMIFEQKVIHNVEYTRATKRKDLVIYADNMYFVILKIATCAGKKTDLLTSQAEAFVSLE